jgi:glucuronosyltransferase
VLAFTDLVGLNGVQEAAYHGVPLIGFPLFADQFDNLVRVQERGYGVIMDRDTFSPEVLAESVQHVLTTPSFDLN